MYTIKSPCRLAWAAALLMLLCICASVPGARAGPRCPSGLLCPDDGWFCCAAARESCCKNIGTGGPFGRRLKTVAMIPSGDPLLPQTFEVWQAGRLLHTTTSSAQRHLSQEMGSNDGNGPTTVQAASIPSRLEDRVPNQRPTVLQLRMTGTDTGQGPTPMRIFKESFYAERDLFVRPAVGGDSRMEGNAKKGIKGPYTRQEDLTAVGLKMGQEDDPNKSGK